MPQILLCCVLALLLAALGLLLRSVAVTRYPAPSFCSLPSKKVVTR